MPRSLGTQPEPSSVNPGYEAAILRSIRLRALMLVPHVGHGNSLSGPEPFCGMLRAPFTRYTCSLSLQSTSCGVSAWLQPASHDTPALKVLPSAASSAWAYSVCDR